MNILMILSLSLGAILSENIVFSHLFGISPFIKGSGAIKSAVKSGISVTVTLTVTAILSYIVDTFIIKLCGLEFMRTFILIMLITSVVFAGELVLRKMAPAILKGLGVSFSIVTCNSAILGMVLLGASRGLGFFATVFTALFSGIGFLAAITLFAAVRERLKYSEVPKALQGIPMVLIAAGLIALAFSGFHGMKIV